MKKLKTRLLTATEAKQLNQEIPEDFSDFPFGFREKDVVLDGPIEMSAFPDEAQVVVVGDLFCKGILEVMDESNLIVTGNLEAEGIIAHGDILVLGNVKTENLFGESGCNHVFCCAGNVRTHNLIEDGHDIEIGGALEAFLVAALMNVINVKGKIDATHCYLEGIRDEKILRKLFVPKLLDKDGGIIDEQFVAHIHKKKPLLLM